MNDPFGFAEAIDLSDLSQADLDLLDAAIDDDGRSRNVPSRLDLHEALIRVEAAAEADSNDEYIAALQEALDIALGTIGATRTTTRD